MGPLLFDYGYGPFRWVCLSGRPEDLARTDRAAMACIDPDRRFQDRDNYLWVKNADKNRLVVGTQARILYQDAPGRMHIALKFNEMVRNGEIGPVMLGRDHHDTGGTDSPSVRPPISKTAATSWRTWQPTASPATPGAG